jgi:hypothetical protein
MKTFLVCASTALALGACSPPAGNGSTADNAASPAAAANMAGNTVSVPAPAVAPSMGPLEYLGTLLGGDGRTSVASAETDLNGDGRNELVVYVSGQDHCGSGGCRVVVLTVRDGAWRMVMDASVSRLPIRLLAASSNGWRDLGVTTGGGGLAPGLARMRFDGTSYPGNPTAPPAEPAERGEGTVLIAEDAQSGPLT